MFRTWLNKFDQILELSETIAHSCQGLIVIMHETHPKRSPPRKMCRKSTPGKIFKILLQVFSNNLHKTTDAHPIFLAHRFCLVKKSSFDLQISSQIDERMKKLQWILNTIMSISVLVIFWCLHIWWCQNWVIYSLLEKDLINCLH